jgi:DNA topoisomerase-1
VNACDYDVEGEVIGYNVIKYACNADPNGKNIGRVKYSTLTKESILKAFGKIGPIDSGLAYAGLTRHTLDWYWGINLSRALTNAARSGKSFKTLSIGRVQGPALKMLATREHSIQKFKAETYWEIEMLCFKDMDFSAMYEAGKRLFSLSQEPAASDIEDGFHALGLLSNGESIQSVKKDEEEESTDQWSVIGNKGSRWVMTKETDGKEELLTVRIEGDKEREITLWIKPDTEDPTKLNIIQEEIKNAQAAKKVKENCGPKAMVTDVASKRYKQTPPFPFDLTTLQTEAYRHLGIDPRTTLEIAQNLYTSAYISYPRTSSQQIPDDIDCKKILTDISAQAEYSELCRRLIANNKFKPQKGEKTDAAHPAIHPTGERPNKLEGQQKRVYDLITRRFMAAFGEDAIRQTVTIKLENNKEPFTAKGTTTIEHGWHLYYGPYAKFEENELPLLAKGDIVDVKDVIIHEKQTQPPKRYSPASIIREMEKRNLGTKATRSQIVDILFKRGYLSGKSIEVTPLGLSVVDALENFCPLVLSEELTRKFEEEMDQITKSKIDSEKVLKEGKSKLTEILDEFKKNEAKIGQTLGKSIIASKHQQNSVGKCPKCQNDLIIRSSKLWQFIGCSNYPNCTQTWQLPRDPLEKSKECKECGYSTVTLKPKGKKRYTLCVNPQCPSRSQGKIDGSMGKCPKCKCDLVVRTSRYGGQFIGCSGYPKCNNLWSLPREMLEKSGICEKCSFARITVKPKDKEPYSMCINPECETRKK